MIEWAGWMVIMQWLFILGKAIVITKLVTKVAGHANSNTVITFTEDGVVK